MKLTHTRNLYQIACLLLLSGALTAQAQTTYIKANNTTALNTSGSWTVAGFPGSGDIGRWDSTVTAANTVAVGGAMTIGEILIANPGGAVSISDATAANILTLNGVSTVGVDMSVANSEFHLRRALVARRQPDMESRQQRQNPHVERRKRH